MAAILAQRHGQVGKVPYYRPWGAKPLHPEDNFIAFERDRIAIRCEGLIYYADLYGTKHARTIHLVAIGHSDMEARLS